MAFARSFEDFTPPKRFDGLAFLTVDLLEAATRDGSYSVIDSFSLMPTDSDPTKPTSRNFTTANATLADGWYVIRWVDGYGASFDSDPVEYVTSGESSDVRDLIARMTDASVDPELTDDDLDDLLGVAARADETGLYRGDEGWAPTWDVNAAAAEGWRRKAGRAATKFNFAEDSQRFDRSQIYQHCKQQELTYASKSMGSLT